MPAAAGPGAVDPPADAAVPAPGSPTAPPGPPGTGADPRVTGLLRAVRRAQLLREREAAALRRRLRGMRPRPPQSMPVPRSTRRRPRADGAAGEEPGAGPGRPGG